METKHKYITLVKDHSDFASEIVEFYSPRYKHPFTEKTVANTAITCLVKGEDNEIIGAVRAISDLSRHGQIVDLIVDEEHRKQKIGTKLLQLIIEELKKNNVKNISIVTEPGIEWLDDFYKKAGFKPLTDGKYLELEL